MNHGYLGFPIAMPTVIEPLSALAKALVLSRAPSWARSPDERMERFTLETLQDQAELLDTFEQNLGWESVGWSWLLINLPYFRSCWMAIWEYNTVCRYAPFSDRSIFGALCYWPRAAMFVESFEIQRGCNWCNISISDVFFIHQMSPGITSIATASPQRTLSDRRKSRASFFSLLDQNW